MSTSTLPPVDRARFVWRPDPQDSTRHIRETIGGETAEDLFNRFIQGEQNLFLGATLTLQTPVDVEHFVTKARAAWLALRHEIPTMAAHMDVTAQGFPLLAYRAPANDIEARAWADRTVIVEDSERSLDDLRFEIGQKPLPAPNKDQTFLYIVPYSETSYGLLLYTHHTPFDGVGTKVLMTLFLRKLARFLAHASLASSEVPTTWGAEVNNLLPSINEALGPDEERDGPRFDQAALRVMEDMVRYPPLVHGFCKRTVNVKPGPTRRLGFAFTVEESADLIAKAKELKLTINQVAHAGVFMVCLKDNPSTAATPGDALLMHFGLVNARAKLAAPYNERLAYPGYCLGMSPIKVPVSLVSENAGKTDRELLLLIAGALKEEYAAQKALPSLLAISPYQGDLMAKAMMSGHHPPPWMGPWYSGDGVGENYLDAEYMDDDGEVVLKVEDFMQSLNKTEPGPFFRSWSWAKRLTLSVDYNEAAMPREDVQGFVDQWVEFVSLIR